MEINKESQEFLNKVKKERKEKLLGIVMDLGFFKLLLLEIDEDGLRKQLDEERSKYKTNKKGSPSTFIGDEKKIKDIEAVINRSNEIKTKIANLESLYHDLNKYIVYVDSLDEKTSKTLNEVNDKFGE